MKQNWFEKLLKFKFHDLEKISIHHNSIMLLSRQLWAMNMQFRLTFYLKLRTVNLNFTGMHFKIHHQQHLKFLLLICIKPSFIIIMVKQKTSNFE